MSWFDTAGIASFAKSALTTAQKTIDKALDIQEEKTSRLGKQTSSKPDTEGFFEAFGLDDKPSTSTTKTKPSSVINIKPSQDITSDNARHHIATNASGFWSDTWGSFFETKTEDNENGSKSKTSVEENNVPEKSQRKDGAVLSQPQKASLFPGDSSELHTSTEIVKDTSDSQESLSSSKECSHEDVQSSHLPHFNELHFTQFSSDAESSEIKSVSSKETIYSVSSSVVAEENVTETPDNNEKTIIVVTEQPSGESPLNLKELKDSSNQTIVENSQTDFLSLSSEVTVYKNIETSNCDTSVDDNFQKDNVNTPINVDISNVPVEKLPSHESSDKQMEESEFFSLQLPSSDEKINDRTESEYDVIELTQNNSLKECDSKKEESFSHPHSTETASSIYNPSSSTLVIPDLPVTVPENIANWECCALDSLSPDLFITEENINSESSRENNSNLTLPFSGSESSLHTISADSFKDGGTWISNDKMHHFINSSQNSSNGERNSHHSDGSSNSSKDDDDTDTAEVKEFDAKSSSSSGSHTTSSSFVKCSVDDTNSTRGHSPTSTIASERSDATKQESEQTTSGDENETATSSDIEILSPPNGENGERNASPLKHIWLPRPLRFRRSESPTSDSSKDSMMPVVSELDEVCYADEPSSPSGLYVDKDDNHQCHKNYGENENLCQLLQKQEELQNLLEAREKKLVELSKENIELQENEQRLKNLMQKMRIEQAKESRDITALTREFTQRLSQVEGQLKDAIKERDALKIQLEEIKLELCNKIPAADVEEIIREKDQQIRELTEEGQKLSKKELQHTTIIKKLRAKQEELNKTLNSQKEELSDNTKEVERLRKSISAKEEQEKKHIDAIRDLSNSVKKLEKEVSSLKSDLEDSTEKELSFKKSLDGTYKDLTELRKSYAAKEVEVQELKSNLELQAKENLQQTLENAKKEAAREKESLILQMQELRSTLSRTEEDANLREKMFKSEIASLQKRLQEAEERNEDLTKNMSSATRPLVRQIENLQATFTTQTISWEKIEKNLTDRLSDAQNQVALLSEKERAAAEKYLDCQSKLIALESQNSSLRQEKMQLTSELESLRTNVAMLEENKSRENYTLEKLKQNFNTDIKKLKQEKANLETTMATCLEQLDVEKRKVAKLEEEIKIKDARAMIMSNVSPCPSPTGSVRSSISSIHNWSQDESHDPGIHTPVNSYRMSVYESLRLGSGSSLLENLQSQLKQREGEIYQLQSEIAKLEQVKESMTRELVQLSEQNEDLDKKLANLEALEKEHKDLDQKYNTLLQMYGEKVEETEELQLDLADVKSMYKAQIEELLMNK